MAASGGGKAVASVRKCAFSLIEVLAALTVLAILCGCVFLTGGVLLKRLADPHSEERVKGEVSRATAWIDDLIYRATISEKNFKIAVSRTTPSKRLVVTWESVDMQEEWSSENIGMQAYSAGRLAPSVFRYDWRTQTLTPALTLRVFKQKDLHFTGTKWFIIVSAYGLVRATENS